MTTPAPTISESFWPARFAIVSIVLLQVFLNERVTAGPNWLLPTLEVALLLPLTVVRSTLVRRTGTSQLQGRVPSPRAARILAFGLIAFLNLANLSSLLLLVQSLLNGSKATGKLLLLSALNIWLTNVIVYALWYWELDRGGPIRRRTGTAREPDLLFPQMSAPAGPGRWQPAFMDYLFVSFTNATAFSPTDTLPLTRSVKLLMMLQSGVSLLTIALVASRAVNILG